LTPKVLPMNQAVVLLAGQPKKLNQVLAVVEDVIVAAASKEDPNAKCMMRFALLAEKAPQFLSNPVVTNRFTAVIAFNREDSTKLQIANENSAFICRVFLFFLSMVPLFHRKTKITNGFF
jgi:hypothetical protein